jgi:hypothetical protein
VNTDVPARSKTAVICRQSYPVDMRSVPAYVRADWVRIRRRRRAWRRIRKAAAAAIAICAIVLYALLNGLVGEPEAERPFVHGSRSIEAYFRG